MGEHTHVGINVARRGCEVAVSGQGQMLNLSHEQAITAQLQNVGGPLMAHVLQQHVDLAGLLTSVKGVGPTKASTLLAQLPELGRLDR